jgi:hypothetical protein
MVSRTTPVEYKKPATEYSVAGGRAMNRRLYDDDASGKRRLFRLNKNATDVGTSVAVRKLNQKIWLNRYAETRPQGYRKQGPMLN